MSETDYINPLKGKQVHLFNSMATLIATNAMPLQYNTQKVSMKINDIILSQK